MTDQHQEQDDSLDWLKWLVVAAIAGGGVYANSYYGSEPVLLRTVGLLLVAGVAAWVAAQTERGRAFVNLCLEARVEIRKVVWPSRQETTHTTIVVLIVVFIVAVILWLLDWGLTGIVSGLIS